MRNAFFAVLAAGAVVAGCQNASERTHAEAPPPPKPAQTSPTPLLQRVGGVVFFARGSHALDDDARAALARQAAVLRRQPDVALRVEGHADERGTRAFNIALGERRANAVRDHLVALGVAPKRIVVTSYGKERPAFAGAGAAAWAQNRRAVLVAEPPAALAGLSQYSR